MAEDVQVFVEDTGNNPISDTYVALHDSVTKVRLQSGITDATGVVTFPAVDETSNSGVYQIRVKLNYPGSITLGSVQSITVVAAGTNEFVVEVTPENLEVASSQHLCRCTGYFLDMTGAALPGVAIQFKEHYLPVFETNSSGGTSTRGIIPSTRAFETDTSGKVVVDLYRNAEYVVLLEGFEDGARYIKVPNAASANLVDIIFPYPNAVEWYESDVQIVPSSNPSVSLTVDVTKTLTYKVISRSGHLLLPEEVKITSPSDDLIVAQSTDFNDSDDPDSNIKLTATQAGTYQLILTRQVDPSNVYFGVRIAGNYDVIGKLNVTVT